MKHLTLWLIGAIFTVVLISALSLNHTEDSKGGASPAPPMTKSPVAKNRSIEQRYPPKFRPVRPLEDPNAAQIAAINQADLELVNDPNNPDELLAAVQQFANMEQEEDTAIEQLHNILNSIRVLHNGYYPSIFDNVDFTNNLLGANRRKHAFINQAHPRINEYGELIDKYGMPYDFHFHSSKDVYVRSFGPDNQPYTADDVVANSRGVKQDSFDQHEMELLKFDASYFAGDAKYGHLKEEYERKYLGLDSEGNEK